MGGKSIRIFLVDGTSSGLRTAEIGLSTCKAVFAPRGALDALAKREEGHRTGVYVLIGPDPTTPGRSSVYVGEGDDVLQRILLHDKDEEKDFWDRVVIFVSKDENLTKAHVRSVEARLLEIAWQTKRATVVNKTKPVGGKLSEADTAEVEEFVDQLRLLLSTFGVSAFEPAPTLPAMSAAVDSHTFFLAGDGYSASCLLIDGEFVVKAGSSARLAEAPSLSPSSIALRKELLSAGVLVNEGWAYRFTQDYSFGSSSGAAQVVCGANVSGRAVWKLQDGTTLKQFQDSSVDFDQSL
ncbi:MAG TPA: GIY-YIG nuclease family protein [Myxococcales bacterium]|jgi:hypothetical protein